MAQLGITGHWPPCIGRESHNYLCLKSLSSQNSDGRSHIAPLHYGCWCQGKLSINGPPLYTRRLCPAPVLAPCLLPLQVSLPVTQRCMMGNPQCLTHTHTAYWAHLGYSGVGLPAQPPHTYYLPRHPIELAPQRLYRGHADWRGCGVGSLVLKCPPGPAIAGTLTALRAPPGRL
uniref:Uncharacterized protein n=1 Tax=Xenopus tropicalis TaxID=8364 RepID=A0A1B8XTE5_XENTR